MRENTASAPCPRCVFTTFIIHSAFSPILAPAKSDECDELERHTGNILTMGTARQERHET